MTALWFLLLVAVKAACLLSAAMLAARLVRRAPAAFRHAVLLLGFAGALSVPVLQALLPGWPAGLTPSSRTGQAVSPGTLSYLPTAAALIWITGTAVLLIRLGAGLLAARRFVLGTTETTDARLLSLAIDARSELGFRAPLRVHLSDDAAVPLSFGIFRHRVVLPRSAARWPRSRVRAVLLHELSHLARRDCLTQLFADACRAIFWFLPMAWWNARAMRFLREVASDDRVLSRGARPSRYAAFLLSRFRDDSSGMHSLRAAAALGGEHELEGRIRAILSRGPGRAGTRVGLAAAVASTVFLTVFIAGFAAAAASPGGARCPGCGRERHAEAGTVASARAGSSMVTVGVSVSAAASTRSRDR